MPEDFASVKYEVHELPHVRKEEKVEHRDRCLRCYYWQTLKDGFPSSQNNVRGRKGDNIGECRFYAPQVVDFEVHWPVTYDFDWCGQFKARAKTGGLASAF